jgi:myo-inositol catabolism protein IolC
MFELLVPATTDADKSAGDRYDKDIRPGHMIEAMKMLQDFGVEPDIWKLEGLDRREQAESVAEQARAGQARKTVGCIILGRGSDKAQVHEWLKVAAPVTGFIGFAVGRTNFSEPLKRFLEDPKQESAAIAAIAENYKGCVDTWQAAR